MKAFFPIVLTPSGIDMEVKLGQQLNVSSSIHVTWVGKTIDSIPHHLNAPWPIVVTLFGMEISTRFKQLRNAPFPMLVTPSGIEMEVMFALKAKRLSAMQVIPPGRLTDLSSMQSIKAPSPMETTFWGI
jgi:hypothetical protein